MANDVIHTRVFDFNIKAYRSGAPLVVNQGGTRSGKSYSIMQLLFYIAKGSNTPLVISVVSRTLPHLKLGVMRDFDNILTGLGIAPDSVKNKTDSIYKIGQSIIEFWGTDNIGKVHGPQRDILFVNEANFIKKDIFDQLAVRTKGTIFLDYNPSRRFWYHDEIQGKQAHEFYKSTYLDNTCLSPEQIARIEAKKSNENWWKVYGEGELGRLEGAILTNWRHGDFDTSLPFCYGLDFGSNDPDALIKVAVNRRDKLIYWHEELYQNNLTTSSLLTILKDRSAKDAKIIADSSARRTIMDMKAAGMNVSATRKFDVPVLDGIRMLQDYTIIITPTSYNLSQELDTWVWVDKRGGLPLDANNHGIDAGRYGSQYLINPVKKRRIR